MKLIKFQWKRWLLLPAILLIVVPLAAGCAPAAEEGKPVIKIYDGSWESNSIGNAIVKIIIEEGYGYPTEIVVLSTPVMQVSLADGSVHINMELWTQSGIDWYKEEIAAGTIEDMSIILEGGPQFFIIPQWVADEHNIKTVFDMKENWELFKDPDDPSKGRFINCMIGWQCGEINKVKMEVYGLTDYYNIISSGAADAMDAELTSAQLKHEPVFGYYWAPTALMGMHDWYILEEPEYNEAVWNKIIAAKEDENIKLDEATAYPSVPIPIAIWSGLRDLAPDVVAMLEKTTIGLDRMNKTAAWGKENEIENEWEKAAVWFMREYDSHWKTWVTDGAYSKVKKFLDEYGPLP